MPEPSRNNLSDKPRLALEIFAASWFAVLLWFVWDRWLNLGFATFDLAFYLQSLWGLAHGQWNGTLLGVPMLGNHADIIVLLLLPLYAVFPHAMIPVIAQIAVLACLAPLGLRIARDLGFAPREAALLGLALLITPATAFVATHEFHPEALTATFLLCLYRGEQTRSRWLFWLSLLGVLACKENMALLLPFWFTVQGWRRWRAGEGWKSVLVWYLPALVAGLGYFLAYEALLRPLWNTGKVDYWNLYAHLGATPGEALANLLTQPQIWISAAWRGATQGNLVWALLVPMLLLPLLRPGWFIIAAPLLAQHLLSWRFSEWMIFNHYPAPLIPIFWLAAVEGLLWLRQRFPRVEGRVGAYGAWGMVALCLILTFTIGLPTRTLTDALIPPPSVARLDAETRRGLLRQLVKPADSVFAPLPYQSHLANRRELYSAHLLLKGLNTLSNDPWEPPARTDVVIMDYADLATFNIPSGYYHPRMYGRDGRFLPSSDELFATWMEQHAWQVYQLNEMAFFSKPAERHAGNQASFEGTPLGSIGGRELLMVTFPERLDPGNLAMARLLWRKSAMDQPIPVLPWADLLLFPADAPEGTPPYIITKGWCVPDWANYPDGYVDESWFLVQPATLPAGNYRAVLRVYDRRAPMFPQLLADPKSAASQEISPEVISVDLGTIVAPGRRVQ